jgi:hypothetical protein
LLGTTRPLYRIERCPSALAGKQTGLLHRPSQLLEREAWIKPRCRSSCRHGSHASLLERRDALLDHRRPVRRLTALECGHQSLEQLV